jgi:hypothetical protein
MFNVNTKSHFTASTKKITSSYPSKTGVFTSAYTPFITTTSAGISYDESSIISGGLGVATLPMPSIVVQAMSPIYRPVIIETSSCKDYEDLAELADTVNEFLLLFSHGNMSAVANSIDINIYTTLSLALSKVKTANDDTFISLYRTVEYSLAGLYQATLQYSSYINVKNDYEAAYSDSQILHNMEALRLYLEGLRGVRSLFGTFNITTVIAKVKPQYKRYIDLYGFPVSSVFEPLKLAECIEFVNLPENINYGID